MDYVTEFTCGTHGHHVYKSVWNPAKNEMLFCWNDDQQEVAEYDKHVIDVSKSVDKLIDHMPIELSGLIDYFLGNTKENHISAVTAGLRKHEVL